MAVVLGNLCSLGVVLLPKCQCFSIACSYEQESREFSMSKSQNMCYCLNSPQFVSCLQQTVIMYHADFQYLLCIISVSYDFCLPYLHRGSESANQIRKKSFEMQLSSRMHYLVWPWVLYPCLSVYLSVKKKRGSAFLQTL